MRKTIVPAALVLTALLAATAPAAAGNYKVNFNGFGTYVTDQDGSAALTGTGTGAPFDGSYTATLTAADGTLPDPGACESGTGTVRITGSRDRFLELTATDKICGQYVQPPYVVTHVFTGRYTVVTASQKRFIGTDGFLEIRLATDGRAGVFAIDT